MFCLFLILKVFTYLSCWCMLNITTGQCAVFCCWRREGCAGMDMWNAPIVQSIQPAHTGWWKSWAWEAQDDMEAADGEGPQRVEALGYWSTLMTKTHLEIWCEICHACSKPATWKSFVQSSFACNSHEVVVIMHPPPPPPPPPPSPTKVRETYWFWDRSHWRERQHKTSCPLCNLNTLWNILMILGRNVDQNEMMCHIQDW